MQAHPFAVAFDTVQKNTNDRFQNPFWKVFRAVQTKGEREITDGVKVMKASLSDNSVSSDNSVTSHPFLPRICSRTLLDCFAPPRPLNK